MQADNLDAAAGEFGTGILFVFGDYFAADDLLGLHVPAFKFVAGSRHFFIGLVSFVCSHNDSLLNERTSLVVSGGKNFF